jgi:hypothetical protein
VSFVKDLIHLVICSLRRSEAGSNIRAKTSACGYFNPGISDTIVILIKAQGRSLFLMRTERFRRRPHDLRNHQPWSLV